MAVLFCMHLDELVELKVLSSDYLLDDSVTLLKNVGRDSECTHRSRTFYGSQCLHQRRFAIWNTTSPPNLQPEH